MATRKEVQLMKVWRKQQFEAWLRQYSVKYTVPMAGHYKIRLGTDFITCFPTSLKIADSYGRVFVEKNELESFTNAIFQILIKETVV